MGQRIVQVVTTIVISDSDLEDDETYTRVSSESHDGGSRAGDVLAASVAFERVRKGLRKDLNSPRLREALEPRMRNSEENSQPDSSQAASEPSTRSRRTGWRERVKRYGYCDLPDCYCDGVRHP